MFPNGAVFDFVITDEKIKIIITATEVTPAMTAYIMLIDEDGKVLDFSEHSVPALLAVGQKEEFEINYARMDLVAYVQATVQDKKPNEDSGWTAHGQIIADVRTADTTNDKTTVAEKITVVREGDNGQT